MRQLIINADDFGMNPEVNEGIKRGIDAGIINSVSVMVNMPEFEDAVRYLKKKPQVSVGLHFNITEGQPILPPNKVPLLIREDNNFFTYMIMIAKLVMNPSLIKQINEELKSQFSKLKKTGLKITHIDSHNHIHLFPSIFKKVLNCAKENNLYSLRTRSFNLRHLFKGLNNHISLKQVIVVFLCLIDSILYHPSEKLINIVGIYDMGWDKNIDINNFKKVLKNVREGITEIICHPAVLSRSGNPAFLKQRYHSLTILLDKSIKKCMDKYCIKLYQRNGVK